MTSLIEYVLSVGHARIRFRCLRRLLMSLIELICHPLNEVIGTGEFTSILLLYDFSESCTTYFVSRSPNTIGMDYIGGRLSSCFQDPNASKHGELKRTDPFWLYRVIIAQIVHSSNYICGQLQADICGTTIDTYQHIGNPDELKIEHWQYFYEVINFITSKNG